MRIWTVHVGDGAVSVVARPLGDELLFSELEEIREAGVDVLVSLLEGDELPIRGLIHEELAAPAVGLRYVHMPTADQTPPATDRRTLELLAELGAVVLAGGHVAAHCHAGHGRSPAFACGVLVMAGYAADEAMAAMSLARQKSVPHRESQREWVRWLEQQRHLSA